MPKINEQNPDKKMFNWCFTLEEELQMAEEKGLMRVAESLRKKIAEIAPERWGTERMYTFGNRASEDLEEGEGYEW